MFVDAPQDFMTGSSFKFEVFDTREPGHVHKTIVLPATHKVIAQIRSDFAGTEGK